MGIKQIHKNKKQKIHPLTNDNYKIRQIIMKIMEYTHIHVHPEEKPKQSKKKKKKRTIN